MPLTRIITDAFGAATLSVAILSAIAALICAGYVVYFRSRVHSRRAYRPLRYFNLHWIARIVLCICGIVWCIAEVFRPHILRNSGWALHSRDKQWQHNACRVYLLVNLGLVEPVIFLTVSYLLHKSLSHEDDDDEELDDAMSRGRRLNNKDRSFFAVVLVLCLIVFLVQLFFNIIAPSVQFRGGYRNENEGYGARIPDYFTRAFHDSSSDEVFCAYPLFSVIVHGVFSCMFVVYFLYVGMRIISKVINKALQRRIYWLICIIAGFLPLRILFLGFSSLSMPGNPVFEGLVFLGFLAQIVCTSVSVRILVHQPVVDSLAVKHVCCLKEDMNEPLTALSMVMVGSSARIGLVSDNEEGTSAVASHSLLEEVEVNSAGRSSDSSGVAESISFRTMLKDLPSGTSEEISLYANPRRSFDSPESPPLPGKPMTPFLERRI